MAQRFCSFAVFTPGQGWRRCHWTIWAAYLLEAEKYPASYEGWVFLRTEPGVAICP